MDYPPDPPAPLPTAAPLVVRLRNWVGDVVLGVPLLQRLEGHGYRLQLVGKGWAPDLLAGHGWPVEALAGSLRGRVAQLRRLRRAAHAACGPSMVPRGALDGLSLPFSFGSALEMRLAGLRSLGYAHEGRSPLLARAVPRPQGLHELAVYWQLGDALLGQAAPLPERIGWRVSPAAQAEAERLLQAHGVSPGFVIVCPFAGGTFSKLDKRWPGFPAFARELAQRSGREVIACPGPGEAEAARRDFPQVRVIEGVRLSTYAALLQRAALMVSNDTGPGHLAAAVGTPTVSVLGPTNPGQWRAWGPSVHLVQREDRTQWPTSLEVWEACLPLLGMASPKTPPLQ